ncbi:AraC family transcriptional regulator [Allokutzneria sp. A3M-2-11 16]|uniref:helix-turn-helix transcriptional regulator n=1 Tax=Allokutzneria sp. A3M-2-11 16 TaxID=2962043 RepID=UPI0020B7514E|nr:AraC family transcriptional regulator [Allokutzneria sp. A3M-2-11 16]MCP3802244.1 AraC family transcriptional regulator [Allokutzneria sp. A3M-2-11 16]
MSAVWTIRYATVAPGDPYHARLIDMPRHRVERHTHHDFVELMYVLADGGVHVLDEQPERMVRDTLYLLHPGEAHSVHTEDELSYVNIAIPVATWGSLLDVSGLTGSVGAKVHVRSPAVAEAFVGLVRSGERDPAGLDLLRFASVVLPLFAGHPATAVLPDWLREACSGFDRNQDRWSEGVSLLLGLAAVSHGHLDRSMRRFLGLTPSQWVERRRMRLARQLLVGTESSISVIALKCGYGTVTYFSRRFAMVHGVPPRDYRDRARKVGFPRSW